MAKFNSNFHRKHGYEKKLPFFFLLALFSLLPSGSWPESFPLTSELVTESLFRTFLTGFSAEFKTALAVVGFVVAVPDFSLSEGQFVVSVVVAGAA